MGARGIIYFYNLTRLFLKFVCVFSNQLIYLCTSAKLQRKSSLKIQYALFLSEIHIRTHYKMYQDRHKIAVCGNVEELGNWNVEKCVIGEEYPYGSGELQYPVRPGHSPCGIASLWPLFASVVHLGVTLGTCHVTVGGGDLHDLFVHMSCVTLGNRQWTTF